jgi:hypothetical protein
MPVVHPICCGIDVHQAQLTACLRRVDAGGQVTQEVHEFTTTYAALLTLGTWLTEEHCPVAALESTEVYWRPVSHVLFKARIAVSVLSAIGSPRAPAVSGFGKSAGCGARRA